MVGLKIGVIGIPQQWSTETLADAVQRRTGFRLVVDMAELRADVANGHLAAGSCELGELDGLIVKKISRLYSPATLDRIELLRIVENAGVRVFSKPENILRLLDRLSCTVTLRNGDIPMPDTIVTECREAARDAVRQFGETVFKPLYSTKARGMCVVQDGPDDASIMAQIDAFRTHNPMMYIQRKITLPGRDFGMVFLGGKYLGAYARVAAGDAWNTTVDSGGRYERHKPPAHTIALAEEAQRLFGMDFTTVDMADTQEGPVVFEVSAFGGFRGAQQGIGINAAEQYVDYVIDELS